ncbi:DUF3278 domain-containing protein [Lactiplantibacillus carotarum]|uniref:DUF3278 domain-containing protein n=1 Tax=Lactiplantibacillus carotarum TaxID=2993456 RepID=UPI00298F2A5A|nr:DUF3278 domain-containing protein [Lactiplantibacillus carotarum]
MNKTGWQNRFIKWFYGIDGVFDEYQQRELDRAGHYVAIGVLGYVLVSGLVMSLLMNFYPLNLVMIIWQIANVTVVTVATVYLGIVSWRLRLNVIEVHPTNYRQAVRLVMKKALRQTLLTAILYQMITALGTSLLQGGTYWQTFISGSQLISWLLFVVVFGLINVLLSVLRITVVY